MKVLFLAQVRSVVWSADDSKIISCGMDGAVYEWNAYSGKREGESVLKSCSYSCVTSTPDGKTTFAVGSDRTLKEISDSQVSSSGTKVLLELRFFWNFKDFFPIILPGWKNVVV